jgi:hypothetical protein
MTFIETIEDVLGKKVETELKEWYREFYLNEGER